MYTRTHTHTYTYTHVHRCTCTSRRPTCVDTSGVRAVPELYGLLLSSRLHNFALKITEQAAQAGNSFHRPTVCVRSQTKGMWEQRALPDTSKEHAACPSALAVWNSRSQNQGSLPGCLPLLLPSSLYCSSHLPLLTLTVSYSMPRLVCLLIHSPPTGVCERRMRLKNIKWLKSFLFIFVDIKLYTSLLVSSFVDWMNITVFWNIINRYWHLAFLYFSPYLLSLSPSPLLSAFVWDKITNAIFFWKHL